MTPDVSYNIALNIGCLALLVILKIAIRRYSNTTSTVKLVFHWLINFTMLYCVTDIFTVALKGKMYPWVHWALRIADAVEIETMTLLSAIWLLFLYVRTHRDIDLRMKIPWAIPLAAATLLSISNPFTQFVFTISADNMYSRGPLLWVHWAISWGYMLWGEVIAVRSLAQARTHLDRRRLMPLLVFIACPAVAAIFQMAFYGVSISQLGVVIGLVMVHLITVGDEVSVDALTGLNNRGSMDNYFLNTTGALMEQEFFVLMTDLNGFKEINDRMGHAAGDRALQDAASVLMNAAKVSRERLFVCRYGGDEFVIVGRNLSREDAEGIPKAVIAYAEQKNIKNSQADPKAYKLSFSIGVATGSCRSYEEAEALLRLADARMYEEKRRIKGQSAR